MVNFESTVEVRFFSPQSMAESATRGTSRGTPRCSLHLDREWQLVREPQLPKWMSENRAPHNSYALNGKSTGTTR